MSTRTPDQTLHCLLHTAASRRREAETKGRKPLQECSENKEPLLGSVGWVALSGLNIILLIIIIVTTIVIVIIIVISIVIIFIIVILLLVFYDYYYCYSYY